jgi:site-specific recombinase XerD
VQFPNDATLRNELKKQFPSVQFSWTKRCWYLNDIKTIRERIGMQSKTEFEKIDTKQVAEINHPALQRMHETLLLKSYSQNTIKTYCGEFVQLLVTLKNVDVNTLTPERLRAYFLYCTKTLKLSENTLHSRMNAIKFYYEQVMNYEKLFFEEIPRPKKKSTLPKVISQKDIIKLFSVVENPKHLLILKLCYGMGLRVSEIVNLKISNIDTLSKKS